MSLKSARFFARSCFGLLELLRALGLGHAAGFGSRTVELHLLFVLLCGGNRLAVFFERLEIAFAADVQDFVKSGVNGLHVAYGIESRDFVVDFVGVVTSQPVAGGDRRRRRRGLQARADPAPRRCRPKAKGTPRVSHLQCRAAVPFGRVTIHCSQMTVHLITTGGTIEKIYSEQTGQVENLVAKIDRYLQQLRLPDVTVEVTPLMNKDSLEMIEEDRELVLAVVKAKVSAGPVVITHGTDTMVETGRLLKQRLGNLKHPVILTGAMTPLGFERSDGLQNLTESLFAARVLQAGVWIVMHGDVFDVDHARKDREHARFIEIWKVRGRSNFDFGGGVLPVRQLVHLEFLSSAAHCQVFPIHWPRGCWDFGAERSDGIFF